MNPEQSTALTACLQHGAAIITMNDSGRHRHPVHLELPGLSPGLTRDVGSTDDSVVWLKDRRWSSCHREALPCIPVRHDMAADWVLAPRLNIGLADAIEFARRCLSLAESASPSADGVPRTAENMHDEALE